MRNLIVACAAAGSVAVLGGCATTGGVSKADKRFLRGEYETAIELYKADVAKGKDIAMANYRIAEAYRLSNRIEQAESYYKAALDGAVKNPDAAFNYALALKANGKFEEAATQFQQYATNGTNRTLVARAEREAQNAKASTQLTAMRNNNEVMPLDQINSPASDYSATIKPDTKELIFASGRDGKKYLGNGENFTDLYAIKFDDMDKMTGGTVAPYSGTAAAAPAAGATPGSPTATPSKDADKVAINKANTHEASATYSPDGKTMIFARSNDGSKKGFLSVDLYVSYFRGGAWTQPELLKGVNNSKADDFSPVLSPDGQTLYFASSRPGGQGGNDIYKATMGANNRFSAPENLGDQINTPGNDNFPAVAPDGTLYFSSDGHPGFGKLDLFRVEKNGKVTNLGAPINSNGDDFAPYMTGKDMGVFSSNRAGGKGSDDLYMFRKKPLKLVTFYAEGKVQELDTKTGATAPLSGETVTITNAAGQKQDVQAGADGTFKVKLDSATAYSLVADRPGYFAARQSVSTVGRTPAQDQLPNEMNDISIPVTLTLNKIVVNKAIVVENIFYDYDKWDIRPDAATELDKLVQTLVDNPDISIELSSHTDSRGKDAYNQTLSQKRAQSAVDYIISKGVDKSRITAKGYGETKPVIKTAKTEEEYQKNRRTEFKVTKINQAK
ncbi:OmpA family protein [Hymenobacter busanensis]|uniref:OmpA family protein n=1 Tax=Hymenobacter busanensis TaxID=2607656 RepID=A0A7L5A094_9BACT|nr:OmpA family protein [Hymenobacter busanensis]KAA9331273.1 OmpA family protein [Hymenobacter busanensis]QHJ08425.1 OmpA family protein [Hymenobacter busanensis]